MRMHSAVAGGMFTTWCGKASGTESVAPTADILRRRSTQSDRVHGAHGSGPIGDRRSRLDASQIGSARGVRRRTRHETSTSKDTDVGGRRNAPGQRTRNGVPTRPRIPRNGVVAVIIMVGPLSVSSCRSRPPLPCSGSRRENTIGTAIRSATPFSELSEIAFTNRVGTVRGSWSRAALRAGCRARVGHRAVDPVPGGGACTARRGRACGDVRDRHRASRLHGATSADRWRSACSVRGSKRARCGRPRTGWRSTHRAQATPPAPHPHPHGTRTAPRPRPHRTRARRRPGTEPVPGPRRRTAATASRVPPRPPSARRPRRRSARCPRRSRHRRPRASRCGRRPRAG